MSAVKVGSTTTDYIYSAVGQLIKKTVGSTVTLLMSDEAGHLLGEYTSTGVLIQETIWMGDIPVATLRPKGSTACTSTICIFYVHTDQLNAPRKISQPSSNTLAWRWDTDPFGTAAPNQNPGSLGTFVYNLRFPGQYYQSETGLSYNYFRDYDPQTGRYVESDPIGLASGVNTFAYAGSNPIGFLDPYGLYAVVQVNGNQVTITIPIEYQGPGVSPDVVQKFNNGIRNLWSGKFGDYVVTTRVTQPASGCPANKKNTIQVPKGNGRAFVNGLGGNTGTWPAERPAWTAAHESGHLMGLPDQYTDAGGPNPGYAHDIVGARGALPTAADIANIIRANP
jgi:RHS repeat-associated protein